jgi:myotubularin-related protein 5/13
MRSTESYSSEEEGAASTSGSKSFSGNKIGVNLFDYIDAHAARSPVFYNFMYSPELTTPVLRPYSHIMDLRVWDYFLREELKHGPSYDLELFDLDVAQEHSDARTSASDSFSSSVAANEPLTSGYDNLSRCSEDIFTRYLFEISATEQSLGVAASKRRWRRTWDAIDTPPASPLRDSAVMQTTPSLLARFHGRAMHKRSTIELIMRGKSSAASEHGAVASSAFANTHRFDRYSYSTPTSCDVCGSLLWGPVVRNGLRCADCNYNCHDRCREAVTRPCTKTRTAATASSASSSSAALGEAMEGLSVSTVAASVPGERDRAAVMFPAEESSQIVCQGYLYKQANFRIKGWKQRWFVLDATKHQLRYYDTREDFACKGAVELSEVTRVDDGSASAVAVGAPVKRGGGGSADDECYFDLVTLKRTFCFCADSPHAAKEWVAKIQSCLST